MGWDGGVLVYMWGGWGMGVGKIRRNFQEVSEIFTQNSKSPGGPVIIKSGYYLQLYGMHSEETNYYFSIGHQEENKLSYFVV